MNTLFQNCNWSMRYQCIKATDVKTITSEEITRKTAINPIKYWYLLSLQLNVDKVVCLDAERFSGYILMNLWLDLISLFKKKLIE